MPKPVDIAIADWAEKARGHFEAHELRSITLSVDVAYRGTDGRFFEEGDVLILLEKDDGPLMPFVRTLTRFGIGKVSRAVVMMRTQKIAG